MRGERADGRERSGKEKAALSIVLPVPLDAPSPPRVLRRHGALSTRYVYREADNALLGFIDRFDTAEGKTFTPLTLWREEASGALVWLRRAWPAPRPLYGLDQLAQRPEAPVLVCEGEKAADAAAELAADHVVIASPNGSNAAKQAAWEPLRGRMVTIWPDADEAGYRYAVDVARLAIAAGAAAVHVVASPKDAPRGWDAADAVADCWTPAAVQSLLEQARPFAPSLKSAPPPSISKPEKPKSFAARTAALVEGLDLWRGTDDGVYATLPGEHGGYSVDIRGSDFKAFATLAFYRETGSGPSSTVLEDARNLATAIAFDRGQVFQVHRRIGKHEGDLYISLAEPKSNRAIRITPKGWSVIANPPIKFVRTSGMSPLPEPERGERIEQFLQFANVMSENDATLLVGWLISAFHPTGPYPILVITGEQGSAKSTLARLLRRVIDPNQADTAALPRDERDLAIAAQNRHLVSYDNVSKIQHWLSDALSRIATTGSFATRKLHSDRDETILKACRPILLNGITDFAARSDLADRCIFVELTPITPEERLPEAEVMLRFEIAEPEILGAICDALQAALANQAETKLPWSPRMADAARWVTAAEPGLGWEAGQYLAALKANSAAAKAVSLDADPVAWNVIGFLTPPRETEWEGSPTEFLDVLNAYATEGAQRHPGWPRSPAVLGAQLKRMAPNLREQGIEYINQKGGADSSRKIYFQRGEVVS